MFFRRRKEAPPSFEQQLEAARAEGFTVENAEAGRIRISKHGCAAVVEHTGGGQVRFVQKPGVVVNGEISELVDRGFQKFLATSDGVRRPAQAAQLRAVHQFDEELRQVLHLESLYNESLGTVSNRYVYDRVQGRE
jgi:hypothetical protein